MLLPQFLRKLDVMDGLAGEETVRAFLVVKPDVKFPFDGRQPWR